MKKVLIITYYWPPSGGAGVQRSLKFVKFLSSFGVQPFVLTVREDAASYPLLDPSLDAEVPGDVTVTRTASFEPLKILQTFTSREKFPHGGFANTGKESAFQKMMKFVRGNFFIPDARVGWVSHASRKAAEIIEKEKIDTIYISSPPHSSQLIGLKLKARFPAVKWIADLRDPWTDIYYYSELMHTGAALRKDAAYEMRVLKEADEIITVSDSIRRMFVSKTGLPQDHFHVIPNGYDEDDFNPVINPVRSAFYVTYTGSMAASYKPEPFFRALQNVAARHDGAGIRLRMVGTHAGSARAMIGETGLAAITEFIPQVEHAKAVELMQQSAVLFLAIPDVPQNEGILTGKLFEYMASRRPIVALGPVRGDAARILEDCRAGVMFERHDTGGIEAHLESLLGRWEKGEDLSNEDRFYEKFSRRNLTRQLASYL